MCSINGRAHREWFWLLSLLNFVSYLWMFHIFFLFIHSFIQKVFMWVLSCAMYCFASWRNTREDIRQSLPTQRLVFLFLLPRPPFLFISLSPLPHSPQPFPFFLSQGPSSLVIWQVFIECLLCLRTWRYSSGQHKYHSCPMAQQQFSFRTWAVQALPLVLSRLGRLASTNAYW